MEFVHEAAVMGSTSAHVYNCDTSVHQTFRARSETNRGVGSLLIKHTSSIQDSRSSLSIRCFLVEEQIPHDIGIASMIHNDGYESV